MHPAEQAKPRNPFVWRLQSVRGLAALVVAVSHALGTFEPQGAWARIYRGLAAFFYGRGAVYTFLILSGFVLGLSLARHREHTLSGVWPFLVRRFWRLWPAMLALSLLYELYGYLADRFLANYTPPFFVFHAVGLQKFLLNVLMLSHSLNIVTWSLQVEWLFSVMVPFTFIWTFRHPIRNIVVLGIALLPYYFLNDKVLHLTLLDIPWSFLFMCYAGVALAAYKKSLADFYGGMNRYARIGVLLGALAVCLLTPHFGYHVEIYTLGMTLIVGAIVSEKFPTLFAFLDFKPLVWLGNISYSFYLLNPLALCISSTICCAVASRPYIKSHFLTLDVLIAVTSIALTIPMAALSFRFLEHPFLRPSR